MSLKKGNIATIFYLTGAGILIFSSYGGLNIPVYLGLSIATSIIASIILIILCFILGIIYTFSAAREKKSFSLANSSNIKEEKDNSLEIAIAVGIIFLAIIIFILYILAHIE